MKKLFYILSLIFLPCYLWADDTSNASNLLDATTPCASKVFAEQLAKTANTVNGTDDESVIQQWIYAIFSDTATLDSVLKCPEISSAIEDSAIKFTPIQYTFPNGRLITVNYETQPKVLKQRLSLAYKRQLPSPDPNPLINPSDPDAVWTNTNPAWYGIMVVESGALDNFVGPEKNNTVSMQYINDNISSLYPHGMNCTTKHALARDTKALNRAVTQTVGAEDDSNDYYVSGDANLEWIGYTEIALDVVVTVATSGGWTVISGITKGTRASRALHGMVTTLKQLLNLDSIKDYIKHLNRIKQLTKELEILDTASDITRSLSYTDELSKVGVKVVTDKKGITRYLDKNGKFLSHNEVLKRIDDLPRGAKSYADELAEAGVEVITDSDGTVRYLDKKGNIISDDKVLKLIDDLPNIRKQKRKEEIAGIKKDIEKLKKSDPNVEKYQETSDTFAKLNDYRHELTDPTKKIELTQQLKQTYSSLQKLRQTDSVKKYINTTAQITKLNDEIKTLDTVTDATKIAEKNKEIEKLRNSVKTLENSNDVKKYKELSNKYSALNTSRHALMKMPKRGNVFTRGVKVLKAGKAALSGNDLIAKGAKLGRASKFSTRIKDWLFNSTLKHIGTLAKVGATSGFVYGAIKFAGDMYDFTESSTGEFTNDIEFKPLLLLSADDIRGQENVVNYGMWLMWQGDSTHPEDDDAAYLQAMDFAAKFHEDLTETQNNTNSPCNVDIFVVRPIIRNPDSDNPQLYYLIMNDIPWTTN